MGETLFLGHIYVIGSFFFSFRKNTIIHNKVVRVLVNILEITTTDLNQIS